MVKTQWIRARVEQRHVDKLEAMAVEAGLTVSDVLRSLIENSSLIMVPVPVSRIVTERKE